jgi:RHS repeat-associated protein
MTYDDANRITAINSLFDGSTTYSYDNWYDPTIGKWISQDPIKFEGGDANLYRVVGNHTTYASDPSGLEEPFTVNSNVNPLLNNTESSSANSRISYLLEQRQSTLTCSNKGDRRKPDLH